MTWRAFIILLLFLSPATLLAQGKGGYILDPTETKYQKRPIPYPHLREANIMWSKRIWRKLDLREKLNHPLYFPIEPTASRVSLAQLLVSAAAEGSLSAYDPFDDEFTTTLTKAQINAKLFKIDTFYFPNPDPPYDMEMKIVRTDLNYADIKEIRIKEDWVFDRERSVLEVRIIGIQLVKENLDPTTGEVRGTEPLFWFYFPELRPLLVNTPVFNTFNDAEQMSYDDLFWKRRFSSYIYKESNVYDRNINEYTTGLDAMLEAEDIKEDIFIFEDDLWEY